MKLYDVNHKGLNLEHVFCSSCQNPMSCLPFLITHERSNNDFSLLYLDLWTLPQLYFNNKNFLSIIDDFSRLFWFFPLQTKDQTSHMF